MSTNPYQSPVEADEPAEEIQPPRYLGKLRTIQGSLSWDEALALVKSRKPINVGELPKAEAKKQRPWYFFVISLMLVGASFLIVDPGSAAGTAGGGFLGWWCVGIPVIFVVVVIIGASLINKLERWDLSDPPIDGDVKWNLNELGFSIETKSRDERPIEIFCSWREVSVSESFDAWLLQTGTIAPMSQLIAKEWIEDDVDRSIFENFLHDVARWRATQSPVAKIDQVPDEASESFPDYQRAAIRFENSWREERRVRRAVTKDLRDELTNYRATKVNWTMPTIFGVSVLISVPVLLVGMLTAVVWSMMVGAVDLPHLSSIVILVFLLGWFSRWLWKELRRDWTVVGAVTDAELWYDYRSVLVRIFAAPFTYRQEHGETLVLATPDAECAIVLAKGFFAGEEDFERAKTLLDANS